jgi:formylglycine-generating enzyme required for sulfatase activity
MSAYDYPPKPEIEALLGTLRGRTLPVFGRLGAALVPAEVRIAAAEALGRGGDPRLAGDTMIELPGCGGVSLGKYPVTVQEFQGFVEAGGYDEQKYWSEAGWQIKVQREWSTPYDWERQTEHPNWPVTWVSWVEAAAWCNWRGRATGQMVRLPTEAEWQSAASPDGRRYPWGEAEPDPERANFGEKVGSPTPVGIYPAGNGPLGHCDLAGNVFEWGLDVGRDDQPVTEANPSAPVGDEMHVFRGGAWNTSADLVRTEVRSGCPSGLRAINLGFRCARVQGVRPAGTGDGGEVR